jgi:NAD(P)-dependent dehydrogenase (short-subunit alcohol dehydrogenase family)
MHTGYYRKTKAALHMTIRDIGQVVQPERHRVDVISPLMIRT